MNWKELKKKLVRLYARRRVVSILETEEVDCPLCGSKGPFKILYEKDRYNLPITTVECSCGLIFENPMPTNAFMDKFYGSHVYRALDWGVIFLRNQAVEEFGAQQRAQKHINLLEEFFESIDPESVLDVGASEGTFLGIMKERCPQANLAAVEPGKFSKAIAGSVRVYNNLASIPAVEKFSLITIWHVLEHATDPRSFIRKVVSHLSKSGVIVIEVPDIGLYDSSLSPIHIDHITHWNEKTLTRLLEEENLEVIHVNREKEKVSDPLYGMAMIAKLKEESS